MFVVGDAPVGIKLVKVSVVLALTCCVYLVGIRALNTALQEEVASSSASEREGLSAADRTAEEGGERVARAALDTAVTGSDPWVYTLLGLSVLGIGGGIFVSRSV